jgi:transcriptional regulator GlxA family with amidase domain
MKRIAILVFPDFQILDLAAIAAFELANLQLGKAFYRVELLSEDGGMVTSSSGAAVDSRRFTTARFDTLVMTGALTAAPATPRLCRFLRSGLRQARRVTSICTGAFALAEAGLLDGRRATTHWGFAQELQRRHPRIQVQPDRIFIQDGPVWTSAGMTAGIDLVLALVEEDLGAEIARAVAKKLVVYYRRPGGQSQFSAMLELEPKSDRIQKTLAHARAHLRAPLSVEDLAEVAHLSPRQFSRAFKSETGQSPAHAIEGLRVEAARALIDAGERALGVVARETGFGDPERMRRAFLRTLGQPPQSVRRSARAQFTRPIET